jgi:hypothetical protein
MAILKALFNLSMLAYFQSDRMILAIFMVLIEIKCYYCNKKYPILD